ncbi:TAXI family TRAP transporter solute-binding subunit [Jiella avicenniae]|uniref:TAXI family TRAP transporter solute-binding subunit n=1 Tax=Jiella avicenniae TaxID=2907202 RepID=A0A9X1T6A0_9HYPH|nr:TAXI family TRAP transporter solute-binding subunit [Jiella avicenniae]MCE7030386.1 TAXI family TRAP transporter solute-binding subunit [Jiella avicenniae]
MRLFTRLAASAVVAGLALAPAAASAQQFINVLTGGTSGVYYPLGVALAKVYSDNIEGVKTQVQSTKASVENIKLVTQGRGEIGFALGDSVKAAAEGDAEAGFPEKVEKLRAIAAIYPNYVQIVASKDSGITDLEGLKGKALSVGAPASGTELNARAIFEAAGMSYDDLGKTEYLPFAESVELIKNRQLDATLQSAGLGVASIRDLAASLPITVVAVPAAIAEKLGAPFQAVEIPAGTYDGQDQAVPTLAITNILVTSSDVDEELAYQMTKQLFEHLPELVAAHNAAKAIDPKTAAKNLPVPLHPGAERYYKEAGLL